MIISKKYSYIFIALPFSGASAISKELIENYDGHLLFAKHTNYPYLAELVDKNILSNYKIIAVYKDPVKIVFTTYNKYLTNHKETYTNSKFFVENGGHVSVRARKRFREVHSLGLSFIDYVERYFSKYPYDNVFSLNHRYLDYVVDFDDLNNSLFDILSKLNIEKVRDLPSQNKTVKTTSLIEISEKLKNRIFGPFYRKHIKYSHTNLQSDYKSDFLFYTLKPLRYYQWTRRDRKITPDYTPVEIYFKRTISPENL